MFLLAGCGGGDSKKGDDNASYSSTEAENNMYMADGMLNDIVGLTRWATIVYDTTVAEAEIPESGKLWLKNKHIACKDNGALIVNGHFDGNQTHMDELYEIQLNQCPMQGTMLDGIVTMHIVSNVDSGKMSSIWDINYTGFTLGTDAQGKSVTNATIWEQYNSNNTGMITLDGKVSNDSSAVDYHNFVLKILQSDPDFSIEISGHNTVEKSPAACALKTYDIQTLSTLTNMDSILTLTTVSNGALDINGISYTFNESGEVEVVDGRVMWTMKPEDYNELKCDKNP